MRTANRIVMIAGLATCLSGALSAGVVAYTSRALFQTLNPGLPVEGFEAGSVADGDFAACPSPLNSVSGNSCFAPGQILAGLEINNGGIDHGGAEFALLGAGFFANASKMLLLNFPDDGLYLDFDGAVRAAGFDLFSLLATDPFSVDVFGGSGWLATFSADPAFTGAFFGVVSDGEAITRIRIAATAGDFVGVDDIAFGIPTPEPGTVPLCLFGAAAIYAAVRRRVS